MRPGIDAFASIENRRFPQFWDERQDALSQVWTSDMVLWMNPPWSLWPQAATKLLESRVLAVCIVPYWPDKPWVQDLLSVAQRWIFFEKGESLFELGGKPVGGIRWPVYALLIKGKGQAKNNAQKKEGKKSEPSGGRKGGDSWCPAGTPSQPVRGREKRGGTDTSTTRRSLPQPLSALEKLDLRARTCVQPHHLPSHSNTHTHGVRKESMSGENPRIPHHQP